MKNKDYIVILCLMIIIIVLVCIGIFVFKTNNMNQTISGDYSEDGSKEMKQLGEIKYIQISDDSYEVYSLKNELINVVSTFEDVEFYSEHPDFHVEFTDIDVYNEELELE